LQLVGETLKESLPLPGEETVWKMTMIDQVVEVVPTESPLLLLQLVGETEKESLPLPGEETVWKMTMIDQVVEIVPA
jgi:hypothetical protein